MSYFNHRTQKVILNDNLSNSAEISVGVPQGSCLGPTMFLIYVNDLCKCFKFLKPILYADDTNLFYESKNLTLDIPNINEDLSRLHDWCQDNKLTNNLAKTQYIVIKNSQNRCVLPPSLLILNKIPIKKANEIKFLGILIDSCLSFKPHAEHLEATIRPYVGLIYRCSEFLPKEILILIYNSYVNSKINYCIEAYGTAYKSTLVRIHLLQKRIARIITKSVFHAPSDPLFKKLNVLNIYKLFIFRTLINSHKIFYSLPPSTTTHLSHSHFTRTSIHCLPLPPSTSSCGHRSPAFQAAELWNQLSVELRSISNPVEFRRRLRQHLLL